MSYNGSGTFAINSTGQPVVAGTVISSTVFNSLTADLGTGLSTAITKDGQTTTTARILFAAGISSTLVTDATSISTGSILTLGGLGVTKAAWIGGLMNVAGAATFQSTIGITGALTATTINASGLVAMAAAATVGTTLAVSGTATMAAINYSGRLTQALSPVAAEYALRSTGQTTGWIAVEINNTGGNYVFAGENSAGNNLIAGCSAYDLIVRGPSGIAFSANNGAAMQMRLASTGLSVTGTLGVTGVISSSGVMDITGPDNANSAAVKVYALNRTAFLSLAFGVIDTTNGNLVIKQGGTTAATITGANTQLAGTLGVTGAVNGVFTNSSNGSTSILAGTTKTFTVTYTGSNTQATATVGFSFLGAGGTSWGGMYYIVTGFPNNSALYTVTEVIRNVNGSAVISAVTKASGSWTFTFQNTHGSSAADVSWMTSSNQSALTIVGPT